MSIRQQIRTTLANAEAMSTNELAAALSWSQSDKNLGSAEICNLRKSGELVTVIEERVARHKLVEGFVKPRTARAAANKKPPEEKPARAAIAKEDVSEPYTVAPEAYAPVIAKQSADYVSPVKPLYDKFVADTLRNVKERFDVPEPAKIADNDIDLRCRQLAVNMRDLMQDAIDAGWHSVRLQVLYQASTRMSDLAATIITKQKSG